MNERSQKCEDTVQYAAALVNGSFHLRSGENINQILLREGKLVQISILFHP